MAKIVTISGAPLQRRGFVEHTLAEQAARKAVKAQWLAAGRTIYDFGVAELNRAAKFYLFQHPELYDKAQAMIERDPILAKMDQAWRKRAQPKAQSIGTDQV